MSKSADLQRIEESGVVAVLRGADADTIIEVAEALKNGGVTAIELTADTPGVTDMLKDVTGSFDSNETIFGVGTVLDAETARAVTLAGAEFVVSPSFHEDVVDLCNRYGTVVAPGAMTPTEVITAYEAGADVVKVFPASTLGPGHISSIKGPLGQVPLMTTGGVSLANVGEFINAGASTVGVGGSLIDYDAIDRGDFEAITETAQQFSDAVEAARSE
ncbi:bifunctional 4-hydroxy-2-oxoglutarate aldolase/2-dehydro-3-deoxy-phosphogluconate aldolase [Natronocalculus amylovorans]|uniref:Bifunctional 4-hydroxy-2-oxoglutarate aldolase/2-dehydro-3-deoxy-phosphogluconate aldolase n=1 Tax=Natronocalculus amylovorans TaxID=2917812 RepID=A0AAE3FYQ2_9EURY|nr:bifunctional 4-hydroxy-2-oxoglutarate aldolase/2-dehydro-3-deoxy-phosphogluconate aldolase [Natronocalculus amylovorans]MCL9817626.1 bifunctional 4-hydroxy-2-oxoglutarate aldolase/2-dehydro-3-deoxy-phosphogluconate aldolase [Natronocalculus amylovorans]NUE02457.1 bifunctional 4-hydroxy-2-oxoglutarate aldolase/2-dehydro-3-deoxy-phosphogluconate aldolase [Halorubraceae archaeon YAN]